MKFIKLLCLTIFFIAPTGCQWLNMPNRVLSEMTQLREQSVLALNDGINALQNQSADWQTVLKDLDLRIEQQVQDVLTYNIPAIEAIAAQKALSIALCVKENIKDEVIYYLQVCRAELITGKLPPLPHTKICLTSLSTIDLNSPRNLRNQVVFTGYFINSKDSIRAYLINGSNRQEIPRTKIGFPDISNITVSLIDYPDVTLTNFTYLQLFYNTESISTLVIDKKLPDPPVIETAYTNLTNIVWVPPHTYGDKDYHGHGHRMNSNVYIKTDGTRVYAQVYLSAVETVSDWTLAQGYSNWVTIYTVKPGFRINKILENKTTYNNILQLNGKDYINSSVEDYPFQTDVGRAILVGDTKGDEAGTRTKITLNLNSFKIEIQKI